MEIKFIEHYLESKDFDGDEWFYTSFLGFIKRVDLVMGDGNRKLVLQHAQASNLILRFIVRTPSQIEAANPHLSLVVTGLAEMILKFKQNQINCFDQFSPPYADFVKIKDPSGNTIALTEGHVPEW